MLIYDTLKRDHQIVKGLLEQLVSLEADSPRRKDLVRSIRDELIPHARAEEAVLYNCLREVDIVEEEAMHAYKEHMQAETLLRALQVADAVPGAWKNLARQLKEAVEHHIQEEETNLFALAQGVISDEDAESMSLEFSAMKEQVKNEGFFMTTLDMMANLIPPRLRKRLSDTSSSAHHDR